MATKHPPTPLYGDDGVHAAEISSLFVNHDPWPASRRKNRFGDRRCLPLGTRMERCDAGGPEAPVAAGRP